jgi:hypothetical protein
MIVSQRAQAHGIAAHATMSWLHGRPVPGISMHRRIDHGAVPAPKTRGEAEEAIRLLLCVVAAEMIVLRATTAHFEIDRAEVLAAQLLACRFPGAGDGVTVLERELDATLASLTSPRIWKTIRKLASSLLNLRQISPHATKELIKTALLGVDDPGPKGGQRRPVPAVKAPAPDRRYRRAA